MTHRSRAFSLRRKLGIVFAVLSLMLLGVCGVTYLEIRQIRENVRRLFEENREAELTRSLFLDLQGVQRIQILVSAGVPEEKSNVEGAHLGLLDQMGHLHEARKTLKLLSAGPAGRDPSLEGHERAERRIYDRLLGALDDIERLAMAPEPELEERVAEALLLAGVLSRETHEEAHEAGDALHRSERELMRVIGITTPVAVVVLLLVSWSVNRHVLRPIRTVQDGARRIGRGQFSHRIPIRSRDEIGDLSNEINHMAERLGISHLDLETRVHERTRQLIRADQLAGLGTLAAGIAHEINNPLASIASCAEGLLHRHENGQIAADELVEYLEIIAKESYRAHDIAARLLEFARHDPGDMEPMTVTDGIDEASVMLQHLMETRGITLRKWFEKDLPNIRGNPKEWKQVVLNLLRNAIDVSPSGSTVYLTCRRVDDQVEVVFEDEGGGIAEENLDRIFSPFFTTKAPGEGTGIGLSLVHRILESHGARIEASNGPEGARFRIEFPIPDVDVAAPA